MIRIGTRELHGLHAANRLFPSCSKPHYESEAKCKSFYYDN